jgi:hypothetical protein
MSDNESKTLNNEGGVARKLREDRRGDSMSASNVNNPVPFDYPAQTGDTQPVRYASDEDEARANDEATVDRVKKSGYKNYKGAPDRAEARALARDNKQYMAKANVLAEESSQAALNKIKSGDVKGAIQEGLKAAAEMGGQLATGKILQFMWGNIYYVLPLLYIDFHFIMRYIAGAKVFCALGSEWSKPETKTGSAAGPLAQAPNRALEILEIIAVVLCNAIVIFVLLLVYFIIYALVAKCETLKAFGGVLADLARGILKLIGKCG